MLLRRATARGKNVDDNRMTRIRSPSFADISRLLAPRSIAVIGASDQPGNLGGVAIRLSQKFGYPGSLWPINPRRAEVHGIACHARVADLPAPADLALFATAAESLPSLVRECAGAGIRCGIAWAGGFAEIGGSGRRVAARPRRCVSRHGLHAGRAELHRHHRQPDAGHRELRVVPHRNRRTGARRHLDDQPERWNGDDGAGVRASCGVRLSLHDQYRQRGGADGQRLPTCAGRGSPHPGDRRVSRRRPGRRAFPGRAGRGPDGRQARRRAEGWRDHCKCACGLGPHRSVCRRTTRLGRGASRRRRRSRSNRWKNCSTRCFS